MINSKFTFLAIALLWFAYLQSCVGYCVKIVTSFRNGSIISFKCLANLISDTKYPQHHYLNSNFVGDNSVYLSSGTTAAHTGSRFKVHRLHDESWAFQSLGTVNCHTYAYLDGRTIEGDLILSPNTNAPSTGTHWKIEKRLQDKFFALKCLGDKSNPEHIYLDVRVIEGSVGLAPTTESYFTGTHWEIEVHRY
jgi:hypothetical protein